MAEFRVRARAVDMLGRQQIAGIPTAVHELFKNAHDAYAQQIEVDYFRKERLFVLRDDGLGMAREDIEDRWLTLGTESRLKDNDPEATVWTGPRKLPRRVIMGEKGIGRLAVAAIGPVTLLISRAVKPDGLRNTVAVLVHWGLFEQPGIDVSSILIPIRETGDKLLTKTVLEEMIAELYTAIKALTGRIGLSQGKRLLSELSTLRSVDPLHLDRVLNQDRDTSLSLSNGGHGTWFIVAPTAFELNDDIDTFPETMGTSEFNKALLGFANVMDKDFAAVVHTEFRDHRADGVHRLLEPKQFFTAANFEDLDHLIEGAFDEHGQFRGFVSFYGEKKREFVLNWTQGKGQITRCGPFRICIGALQGRPNESRLDRADHITMSSRLNKLGGLYIYKDGIRVLPYGTAENDFLNIELRRTLAAKDWYFSYRRMIGFIALTHRLNSKLSEKAGREGFRQNYAYRDLRSVLEEFIKGVAVRFFRSRSEEGSEYQETKARLVHERDLLEQRSKRAGERRRQFQRRLLSFREDVDNEAFEIRTRHLLEHYLRRLERVENEVDDELASESVVQLNSDIRADISEFYGNLAIGRPRGLALTKSLERDWNAYRRIYPQLIERTVGRLETLVADRVAQLTDSRISGDRRRTEALAALESRKEAILKEVSDGRKEISRSLDEMRKSLKAVLQKELGDLRNRCEAIINDYSIRVSGETAHIEKGWNEVERSLRKLRDSEMELVDAVRRQLNEFRETIANRTTVDDEVAALERSIELLREQVQFQSELAQAGMAVGILGHEFNHMIGEFRDAVHELKDWADGTVEMRPLYSRLRTSFEGLEGYLQMLTPLGRRLTRRRVEISGSEIEISIRRIFARRLRDRSVRLVSTSRFSGHTVKCRTAAVLSAFVNIVDNALYWTGREREEGGLITLDASDDAFLISNNGPGISELDAERIFEFGWTSKPGGAGMGLSLASDALNREGFMLELRQRGSKRNPVFAIVTDVKPEDDE